MNSTLLKLNKFSALELKYNLGPGVPPLDLLPSFDAKECINTFENAYGKTWKNYHSTEGVLSEIFEKLLIKEEGFSANSTNIIASNGVQEAMCISLMLKKGLKLAVFKPTYPGVLSAASSLGTEVLELDFNDLEVELRKLSNDFLLYVCPDFSNPTGKSLTYDERALIAKFAESNNFIVFEDVTYRPFYIQTQDKIRSIYALAPNRVIYSFSFSKVFSPALRVALNIVPTNIYNQFELIKASLSINSSGFSQAVLGGWLINKDFSYSNSLRPILERLKENHSIIDNSELPSDEVLGGFFRLIKMQEVFDSPEEMIEKEGILVLPMAYFSNQSEYRNIIRIAIANIPGEKLSEAVELLKGK